MAYLLLVLIKTFEVINWVRKSNRKTRENIFSTEVLIYRLSFVVCVLVLSFRSQMGKPTLRSGLSSLCMSIYPYMYLCLLTKGSLFTHLFPSKVPHSMEHLRDERSPIGDKQLRHGSVAVSFSTHLFDFPFGL